MMNTIMKRILSLALAMLCLAGLCINLIPGKADAATVGNSASSISVNSSGMYVVKNKTALRSSTGKIYSTYATLEKGTLVEGCGCSRDGKFIMVNAGGKTYWVKRSDLYDAGKTRAAKIYYCTKSVVLRNGPYEKAAKVTSLAKGSVIAVVGQLKNSYGHTWYAVYYNGHIRYLYATGNVKAASKLSLKVSGENRIAVGQSVKLSCSVNPSAVVASWSSSNRSVATVDISGKLKGVAPGTATITAEVGGGLKVSFPVTVYEYAIFPAQTLNITQVAYGGYSHSDQNAVDFTSNSRIVAPFTGKITYIDKKWGYVVLQSTHKVMYADGTFDYMTVSFMHDGNVSDLYVGKVIQQGTAFYDQGGMGKGNPNKYAYHVHMAIWRGKTNGRPYGAGNVYVFDALYIKRSFTTKISCYGKSSSSGVYNNAPKNYEKLWRYIS